MSTELKVRSAWELLTSRFGSKPDHDQTDEIDQRDDGSGSGVVAIEVLHQGAHLQGAASREDATGVEGESLPSGAHPRGK